MRNGPASAQREILLTWVGSRDPGWINPRTGQLEFGPVLSLLASRTFAVVYLLFNLETRTSDDFRKRANEVLRIAQKQLPEVEVKHRPVDVISVTDYRELYRLVNRETQDIVRGEGPEAQFYAFLSPGTPQMQTVWVLLVQSALLPAKMIETTPRDLLQPGEPLWREVDLSLTPLPQVVTPDERERELGVLEAQRDNLLAENRRLLAEIEIARNGSIGDLGSLRDSPFSLRQHLL
jgi:sigma54-dependent transcription regulator